jgi:hypothetical protein
LILVWFMMTRWPPITPSDERAKIAEGLSAAD